MISNGRNKSNSIAQICEFNCPKIHVVAKLTATKAKFSLEKHFCMGVTKNSHVKNPFVNAHVKKSLAWDAQ